MATWKIFQLETCTVWGKVPVPVGGFRNWGTSLCIEPHILQALRYPTLGPLGNVYLMFGTQKHASKHK